MNWRSMTGEQLWDEFGKLEGRELIKVLAFKTLGDENSHAEGVYVLRAAGSQKDGIGVLMSDIGSFDTPQPARGDVVQYREVNPKHKPYIVAWISSEGKA